MKPAFLLLQAVPEAAPNGTATQVQPAPTGEAPRAPEDPGAFGLLMPAMVVLFLGFMIWQSRSQQKKQEAAVSALKKGDRVVTQSGLVGRVSSLGDRYVELEMIPSGSTKFTVLRSSVVGRDSEGDPAKAAEKSQSSGKNK